ncbi:hypothetical protein Scep_023207 [Stephania cephalantha]|uniref:F-box domain-containing protein n=1 Tax=Stephania cephalantha TaxID=152367 RepID=A0AAP0HW42_9MAGN
MKGSKHHPPKKRKISTVFDAHLTDDVLICEVFPRLPIKQLFRLKLVCKRFNNSIPNDPRLISAFRSHNTPTHHDSSNSSLYFDGRVISTDEDDDAGIKNIGLRFVSKEFVSVKGFNNGLLYGSCFSECDRGCFIKYKIFICNPITKQFVLAPHPKLFCHVANSLALDFDPKNPHFGFSLIVLYRVKNSNCYQFEVYSSKTGEWRLSDAQVVIPYRDVLGAKGNVCISGKVYWSLIRCILWFDVEENVGGFLPCPPNRNLVFRRHSQEKDYYSEIGVRNGDLSYSGITKGGSIEIWLLRSREGEKEMWEIKHNVMLKEIVGANWNAISLPCEAMKIKSQNRSLTRDAFFHGGAVYPLPYVGGKVVWFWRRIYKRFGKLFSFNLLTEELKFVDNVCLPWHPFTPTLQPCPT